MAVRDILVYPDPRLKQVAQPVQDFDAELQRLIDDLEDTMDTGPGAVGIAAPQIGCLQRVMIIDVSSKPKLKHHGRLYLVNPEILHWEGLENGREGCLSVPDYTGNVVRAQRIRVAARDPRGRELQLDMEGFEARAFQHELDHLDGLLFLDRLVSRRSDLFKRKVYQRKKDAS